MLRSILILPDGTELTSGVGQTNNIRSTALTECVNSGEELTLGSVCAAMMEVTVQTPMGALALNAGDDVTLFKVGADGIRHQVGLFTLEKPTRASAHILNLTGYDRVAKLDKDLTAWLKGLDGWPYDLLTFAGMVCTECGLRLVTDSIPNGDYLVQKFEKEVTGRQLMAWIGEICCRFCRATPYGDIELAWYTPSGVSIQPTGERYFFHRTLVYEDYQVAPIEAVQVRLTDSEDGAPVPTVAEGTNSYIISGNPIFTAITGEVLDNILAELATLPGYTPCKIAIPSALDLRAGHTFEVTDRNGVTVTSLVMAKTTKGQRDTLECTGSPRRDSSTALNNRSAKEQAAEYERRALNAGKEAVRNQTPEEVFNALTGNGAVQGLFLQDGKIYINAEYIAAGILAAINKRAYFDMENGFFAVDGEANYYGKIDGIRLRDNTLYGIRKNEDNSGLATTFELIVRANEVLFSDGILAPSGLPIVIRSSGGLHLGQKGDSVKLMGKQLYFLPNGDGTYAVEAVDVEEEETA